jgi:hypothetical protein
MNFDYFLQSRVLPLIRKLQNLSESVEASSGLDSFGSFLIMQKRTNKKVVYIALIMGKSKIMILQYCIEIHLKFCKE